jgi:hypothetical protein
MSLAALTFVSIEADPQVRFRYGSQLRLAGLRSAHYWTHRLLGFMSLSFLHGELLSFFHSTRRRQASPAARDAYGSDEILTPGLVNIS